MVVWAWVRLPPGALKQNVMTFEEILPHIRNHEKVYRKEWDNEHSYIMLSDRGARYLYLYDGDRLIDQFYLLSGYDITSDDWEIFSEKSS
jgi:hypothetical protein